GEATYFTVPPTSLPPLPGGRPPNALFVMSGLVAYSYLRQPAVRTLGHRRLVDHRIGIFPFDYEWQRSLGYMATVANESPLSFTFEYGVLNFTSRLQGHNNVNMNLFVAAPVGAMVVQNQVHNIMTGHFPIAVNYDEDVPIFDATNPQISFDRSTLSNLHTLPVVDGEIPRGAFVTVGYTALTFPCSNSPLPYTRALALNVQFVLVHA
ncbi:hypothetical protein DFP72DRAFT_753193, partial [Ephemerocybe angulata]